MRCAQNKEKIRNGLYFFFFCLCCSSATSSRASRRTLRWWWCDSDNGGCWPTTFARVALHENSAAGAAVKATARSAPVALIIIGSWSLAGSGWLLWLSSSFWFLFTIDLQLPPSPLAASSEKGARERDLEDAQSP